MKISVFKFLQNYLLFNNKLMKFETNYLVLFIRKISFINLRENSRNTQPKE